MSTPGFVVHKSVHIEAPPEVVFSFFAEGRLFEAWFGEGSRLEAHVGGAVHVAFPGGATAVGEVLEVDPPRRIRFTWGYPRENTPVAPGASVVEVRIERVPGGSRLDLEHRLPTEGAAEAHEGGWAYHLSRLVAKVVRASVGTAAARAVDAFFAAWRAEGDDVAARLAEAMAEGATYRDDAVVARGRAESAAHIRRCHAQMPGSHLARRGPLVQTGRRLACDAVLAVPGRTLGQVLVLFDVGEDGRIREATGCFRTPVPGVSDGPLPARAGADAAASAPQGPPLEPHFWCADLEAGRRFYEEALGFTLLARFPDEGASTWVQLAREEVRVMLASRPHRDPPPEQAYLAEAARRIGSGGAVSLYLRVDDVDAAHRRVADAGAPVVEAPHDPFWGGRQFTVADPDGHWWTLHGPRPASPG